MEGTRGKERFFLEVSDIHLTPQRNEDVYVNELKEQIKQLNEKVDTLDKRNAELTEENRKLIKKSKQNQEENEMENSQQRQSQTIKFWKQKCEILVSKYFSVIKKLKDDNDKLKLRILEDYKELKKETHASNQFQIKHNKVYNNYYPYIIVCLIKF